MNAGTTIPAWVGDYVGVPLTDLGRDRAGCDCWGLVRLVLAERAGVAVPSWATEYGTEADHAGVLGLADREKTEGCWRRIAPGDEVVFDVVELTQPVRTETGWQWRAIHAGIVVAPGMLLHVERTTASLLAAYRTGAMRNRVVAFWRHRALDHAA